MQWLLLDTGCHRSFLTKRAYAKLLEAGAKVAEDGTLVASDVSVGGFGVGSLAFADESAEYRSTVDGAADGYLGMDFLGKYRVGIDLREKTLRLWPRGVEARGWFTAPAEDLLRLPLLDRAEGWCVPVEIGNLTVPMVVDTGASETFLHAEVATYLRGAKKRGSTTVLFYDGRRRVRSYAVRAVGLGGQSLGERTIYVASVPRMIGLLGRDLLSPLKILLDYPRGRATFAGLGGDRLPERGGPEITLPEGVVLHSTVGAVATVPLGASYTLPKGYREVFNRDGTIELVPSKDRSEAASTPPGAPDRRSLGDG